MLKTGLTTSIFVAATLSASSAFGAVAARHYDFEEGTAGAATTIVQDTTTDPLIESDLTGIWETGHFWLEVAGSTARPLPAGGLFDVIDEWALAAPTLESLVGEATFVDVSDGTAFDSPAIGSQLALSFDGDTYFDDINSGSRGVYIERTAYENNDDVSPENTAESFNMIAQGWVYPSSEGMSIAQTVWQSGTEQGSVNITEDGFWEFRDLSSVGDLNPDIAVEFDTWTHIGTRRGGNGAEVFINGELVAGDINPTPPNFFGGFANIITLGGTSATEDGFYGMVDDFKIMGTADLAFDPAIDMDFWATAGPDPCMPVNELLGDLDGVDGVAFADFLVLSTNFGTEVDSYSDGDIDCSGSVDFPDFLTMSANFGMTLAGASPVPEPNGFALLLMGMLTLVRRKRNRAANVPAC